MLYMFTDGYADQKGGPNNKKFFYPPFQKLLAEISGQPMEEQQNTLDSTIEEWKTTAGMEQMDDITIVGIRL